MECKLHITSSYYHVSELKDFDNLIKLTPIWVKDKNTSNEEGECDEQIVHV